MRIMDRNEQMDFEKALSKFCRIFLYDSGDKRDLINKIKSIINWFGLHSLMEAVEI